MSSDRAVAAWALAAAALFAAAGWAQEAAPQPPPAGEPPAAEEPDAPPPPGIPGETLAVEAEEEEAEARSFVSLELATGAGTDDGIVVGGAELEDDFYLARATLLVHRQPSLRTELTFAYEPEAEFHDLHPELDVIDHAVGALLAHRPSRRSRVLVGGSFLDGEDPGLHLGGSILLLPRTPYRQARLYTGYEHRWKETAALFHLSATRTELDAVPGLIAELEQNEYAAVATVEHRLSEFVDVAASYSYLHPDVDSPAPLPLPPAGEDGEGEAPLAPALATESEPLHMLATTLGLRPRPGFGLHLTAGAVAFEEEVDYLAGVAIDAGNEVFRVRLGYDRAPARLGPAGELGGGETVGDPAGPALPSVVVRDAISDTATISWALEPSPRFRWLAGASASRTELLEAESLETVSATTRLVVGLFDRVGIFGELDYITERTEGPDADSDRLRYAAGLLFTVGELPAIRGLGRDREHLARVLPYRRTP
jgi:hypothetical protein